MRSAGPVLAVGALLLMALGGCRPSPPGQRMPTPGREPIARHVGSWAQILDLASATDDQRAKVQQVMARSRTAWQAWWKANEKPLGRYVDEEERAKDANDRTLLKRLCQQHKALVDSGIQSCNPSGEDMMGILAPRQRTTLDAMETQWDGRPGVVHDAVGLQGSVPHGQQRSQARLCKSCHVPAPQQW